jgi:hypothetical protein
MLDLAGYPNTRISMLRSEPFLKFVASVTKQKRQERANDGPLGVVLKSTFRLRVTPICCVRSLYPKIGGSAFKSSGQVVG